MKAKSFRISAALQAQPAAEVLSTEAPFARAMNVQKSARKYDLLVRHGSAVRDSILIRLPEGYAVENLPEARTLSSPVADFRQEFRQSDDAVLVVNELRMKAGRMRAEDYPQFRNW